MSRSTLLKPHYEQAWRLSMQKRSTPIQWAPGQREALIEQAVNAGKVQRCPDGSAVGILMFNIGSTMLNTPMFTRKKGAQ